MAVPITDILEDKSKQQPEVIEEAEATKDTAVEPIQPAIINQQTGSPIIGSGNEVEPENEEPISSFAMALNNAQARTQAATDARNATIERVRQAREQGIDLRRTLFEKNRPERNTDKEKQLRTMGKIQAVGNLLSALGAGIVGTSTKGYVPQTGNNYPLEALRQLNKMEDDYLREEREYKNLSLRNALADQAAMEKQFSNDLKLADKDLAAAQKRFDTLTDMAAKGELNGSQQRELARLRAELSLKLSDDKHKKNLELEKLRQRNRTGLEYTKHGLRESRTNTGGSSANKSGYTFMESDGRTERKLSEAEGNYYYDLGIRLGIIPTEGSKTTLTTVNNRGSRFKNTETKREVPYNFSKQSKEDRTRLIKAAYDAQKLINNGFSETEVREYLSTE